MLKKLLIISLVTISMAGCAKNTSKSGNVTLKVNPLPGPIATKVTPFNQFFSIIGLPTGHAAISSSASLAICNDTLILKDADGNTVQSMEKRAKLA
jgi:hypothetical protein